MEDEIPFSSPIFNRNIDLDFDWNIMTASCMPLNSFAKGSETTQEVDIFKIEKELKNPSPASPQRKRAITSTFHPFSSLENIEQTVHMIRSELSRPKKSNEKNAFFQCYPYSV